MRWLVGIVVGAGVAAAQGTELPLPVARSTTLNQEKVTYVVDGRKRIPWNVDIAVQRDVRIVGRNRAVLEIEGHLTITGTRDREVVVEGVRLEPVARFRELHLTDCIFRGGACVRSPDQSTVEGTLQIENTTFEMGCTADVVFHAGEITLLSTVSVEPLSFAAKPRPDGKPNKVKFEAQTCFGSVRGSNFGLGGGLVLDGIDDATVRNCNLLGAKTSLRNCRRLVVDGSKVSSAIFEIRQDEAGRFAGTKVMKCDFYTTNVMVWAPGGGGNEEKLVLDKCWFKGIEKADEVHATVIKDGNDDPTNGVRVALQKILERPLELAGTER